MTIINEIEHYCVGCEYPREGICPICKKRELCITKANVLTGEPCPMFLTHTPVEKHPGG